MRWSHWRSVGFITGTAPLASRRPERVRLAAGGAYRGLANEGMIAQGAPEVAIDGEVVEVDPPRKLVQTWRVLMDPAMTAEGFTRLTYEIAEGQGGITTLTVTHDWIQITNFVVTGVLTLAPATGMRQVLRPGPSGTWGPLLIGVNGVSMTVSAVFLGRPINGYPLGTAEQTTWHGIVHSAAPALAGLAGLAAYFVFARRFASIGQRKWAVLCVAVAPTVLVLNIAAVAAADFRLTLTPVAVGGAWTSLIAARLMTEGRFS